LVGNKIKQKEASQEVPIDGSIDSHLLCRFFALFLVSNPSKGWRSFFFAFLAGDQLNE